jgi:hypothetical protein
MSHPNLATPTQLAVLRRFVDDQPNRWEVLERAGHHFASRQADVTDEYVWYLQLHPGTPEESPYPADLHPRWEARFSTTDDSKDERIFSGSFADCTTWLDDREREWSREWQVAVDLQEYADARPKWIFHDSADGRYWTGRRFEYETGDRLLLSINPNNPTRRRDRVRAQINAQFSAGPECEYVADGVEGAAAWVEQWEKLLVVPQRLADYDLDAAVETVARLTGTDVVCLADLFDINGSIMLCRRRLVEKFCPAVSGKATR